MKKLSRFAVVAALMLGLAAPACTVDGTDDNGSTNQETKTDSDSTNQETKTDSDSTNTDADSTNTDSEGSNTDSEGTNTDIEVSETVTFSPVYYDGYLFYSEEYGFYELEFDIYDKKISNGEPSSWPVSVLYIYFYSESAIKTGTYTLSSTSDYAVGYDIYNSSEEDDSLDKYYSSISGTLNLTSIASSDFQASFKNVIVQEFGENGFVDGGKKIKLTDMDITSKYFTLIDCDDEDNYDYCYGEDE